MRAGDIAREVRDGDWQLVDWDPQSGRTVWVWFDGEKTHVRTDYPVHTLLDQNAQARSAAPDGWKGDWHRVASVPLNLAYDQNVNLNEAFRQGDDHYISRWLNDPENEAFRTKTGRL